MRELTKITFGGVQMTMRPTFAAYGEIESHCGSLRQVYTSVVTGTATLDVMARVVFIGLCQIESQKVDARTNQSLTHEGVAESLYENGAWDMETIQTISEFLSSLGWTPDQLKKIAAEREADDPDNQ